MDLYLDNSKALPLLESDSKVPTNASILQAHSQYAWSSEVDIVHTDGRRIVGFVISYLNQNKTFKVVVQVRLKVWFEGRTQKVATVISAYTKSVEVTTSGDLAEKGGPEAQVPGAFYPWVKGLQKVDEVDNCPWLNIDEGWATDVATRTLVAKVFTRVSSFDSDIRINAKKKPRIRKASDRPTGVSNYRAPNPYQPMPRGRSSRY